MYILIKCTQDILQDRAYTGQETSLNKLKKIEIIQGIFTDHGGMKLKIHNRRKTGKFTNVWKLSNTLLNSQKEIRNYIEMNENQTKRTKTYAAKAMLRGKFITKNANINKTRMPSNK